MYLLLSFHFKSEEKLREAELRFLKSELTLFFCHKTRL